MSHIHVYHKDKLMVLDLVIFVKLIKFLLFEHHKN